MNITNYQPSFTSEEYSAYRPCTYLPEEPSRAVLVRRALGEAEGRALLGQQGGGAGGRGGQGQGQYGGEQQQDRHHVTKSCSQMTDERARKARRELILEALAIAPRSMGNG